MKRIIAALMILAVMTAFTGCTGEAPAAEKKLKIVCTVFPVYDWTREVLGENADNAELTLLLSNGVDMHSYQPTAADMIRIADCDLLIYVGGESDKWIYGADTRAKRVNMFELLMDSLKAEEITEGMQAEVDDGGNETDEHLWLSLRMAAAMTERIAASLGGIDPDNADKYLANSGAYCEKLAALDAEYGQAAEKASAGGLIFGDRFPFRYLTDDYGLTYYAAFPGCSAETDASFETVIFLADKANELNTPCILAIEGAHHTVAEAIARNTGRELPVLVMDSMQSVTLAQAQEGNTYLSVAKENLDILKKALGSR